MRDAHSDDPNDSRYWPVNLPPRERVELVKQMLAEGYTWRQIEYRAVVTMNRVGYIKSHPQAWDTVDDEVAVERALAGDRSVLPALTLYERARVREALAERLDREPYEPAFDQNLRNRQVRSDHWLTILAENWGVDRHKLFDRLNRFNARARKRAA